MTRSVEMNSKPTSKAVSDLINEVDALCRVYVGKNAPSERWRETCERLERLAKIVKRARAAVAKAEAQP